MCFLLLYYHETRTVVYENEFVTFRLFLTESDKYRNCMSLYFKNYLPANGCPGLEIQPTSAMYITAAVVTISFSAHIWRSRGKVVSDR